MCAHLRDTRAPWLSYKRCYTGIGFEHLLLCVPCSADFEAGASPATFHVCDACLEHATSEVGDLTGVCGKPGILEQPEDLEGALRTSDLASLETALIDIARGDASQEWYGLCADGSILVFSSDWTTTRPVARAPLVDEPDHEPFVGHTLRRQLHVSPSGRFAAVVNDYGRYGVVIDLVSGDITLRLDGGDYHPETVPFSLAFASSGDGDVVVHRTAWNRLDVSDAASGRLLTERGPTSYQRGEDRPDHYLDYFHGRLYLSPDGARLLDDGWVWHPIGIPEVWDLGRWLSENAWESEDGPSKISLDGRDYYWDHGMCWIDSERVAVEGIGTDDDHMVAGARIFDASERDASSRITWPTATELSAFAGPSGEFFSDGRRLYTAADDGLSIWNIETGARTGRIPGFRPRHHARSTGELIELRDQHVVVWRST